MSVDTATKPASQVGRMVVTLESDTHARVTRDTAESEVAVAVALSAAPQCAARFDVASSIDVSAFPAVLDAFARAAGLDLAVDFTATKLSSSHVVLEDTGLALGAGLFEILKAQMEARGVNGAGSSLQTAEAFHSAPVSASISVEGRKFLKMVGATNWADTRRRLILGHNVFDRARSEDMDDFVDALAGGLRASIFVLERRQHTDADAFWRAAIDALGVALAEVFAPNTARKGLPPGVKATLF